MSKHKVFKNTPPGKACYLSYVQILTQSNILRHSFNYLILNSIVPLGEVISPETTTIYAKLDCLQKTFNEISKKKKRQRNLTPI